MVIFLKNRAAIYQREAAEMLHNISLYPGLTENQLCRFFPEKEATAKVLLAHMLKEGRVFCDRNGGYYANQEAQNGADKDLSRCVWVLLDFIDQVEYHTVGEFPAAILCFANGELYEIVPTPQGKETMICQLLRQPQKDAGKRIVWSMMLPRLSCWTFRRCRVLHGGRRRHRQLLQKGGRALNPDVLLNRIRLEQRGLIDIQQKTVRDGTSARRARPDAV